MGLTLEPTLFYEGIFNSTYKFSEQSVTSPRRVEHYEMEIFTEPGGVAYLNGTAEPLRPGLLICAKPGELRHTELPLYCHYVKILPEAAEFCALLDSLPSFSHIRFTEKCVSLTGFGSTAPNSCF